MDERKLNTLIEQYIENFKEELLAKLQTPGAQSHADIIEFIKEFSAPTIKEEDISKRKRVKNPIPFHEKCIAKRANGEQCSRRKKAGMDYCGTHSKACPHGTISLEQIHEDTSNSDVIKKHIEVWLEDINGIMYWINDSGTVYHPDDIRDNKENPRVIAHYEKNEIDGVEKYQIIGEIN